MNSGGDVNTVLFSCSESGLSSCGVSLVYVIEKKLAYTLNCHSMP